MEEISKEVAEEEDENEDMEGMDDLDDMDGTITRTLAAEGVQFDGNIQMIED